jgi:hypothetical protein
MAVARLAEREEEPEGQGEEEPTEGTSEKPDGEGPS